MQANDSARLMGLVHFMSACCMPCWRMHAMVPDRSDGTKRDGPIAAPRNS
ncbi:hypothetical protein RISK_006108 [Rhodopirellula islandica]|uniref:Uncharacterized protein n=1 Tax=Rhodopirellula islandica TaxID=595434 RepID=A0A0J1E8X4_RHOIS|nr:hypothetical protein RISK_006108 [Rhodopirellula islandica]